MSSENMELSKVHFETALDETGFGLYSYILTLLTGVSIISFACVAYSSTIIVPISACELGTTDAQQGMMIAAPVVGGILGGILWGYLADRLGRRKMLLASFLSGALVNGVASLSIDWIMLMVIQFLAASLASGQYTLSMTLLSECVPAARRNLVILVVASIFLLSQGIMSLLAIPIVPLDFYLHMPALNIYWSPWRTVLLVYSLPSFICFVWIIFMQESPKFVFTKGSEQEALVILRAIHRVNKGQKREEYQVKGLIADDTAAAAKEKTSVKELFRPPLLKYFIIMTVLSILLKVNAFTLWLPTISNQFVDMMNTGEGSDYTLCDIIAAGNNAEPDPDLPPCHLNESALLIVFAVGCLASVFNLLLSFVVNKVGRRNCVLVIASVCGVAGILINLVPNAIGSGVLFITFLLSMVLFGLYTAISVALFPTHLRALAVALTMTGGRVVLVVVVQVLNFLLINNCDLGFYIFASMVVVSAMVAAFLPDDRYLAKPPLTEEAQTSQKESTLYLQDDDAKTSL